MEIELIKKLLSELDQAQYMNILRTAKQINTKLRIPGFSKIEKAPPALVVTAAKNSEKFRIALLNAITRIISPGLQINTDKDTQTLISEIPREQWLGLAAVLISNGNSDSLKKANDILMDYHDPVDAKLSVDDVPQTNRSSKKEERFREKYMKAHDELEVVKTELLEKEKEIQQWKSKCEYLTQQLDGLTAKCSIYEQQISHLNEAQQQMSNRVITLQAQTEELSRKELHILAPNCSNVLEQFCSRIYFEFNVQDNLTVEDALQQYDQIWIFPDLVSLGTYRKLKKWKNFDDNKIRIFYTISSLINYADRILE